MRTIEVISRPNETGATVWEVRENGIALEKVQHSHAEHAKDAAELIANKWAAAGCASVQVTGIDQDGRIIDFRVERI